MKLAFVCLAIATIFTVVSKTLQFKTYRILISNIIAIPGAVFYGLAIMFSIPQFRSWLIIPAEHLKAGIIVATVCGVLVLIQLITLNAYTDRQRGKGPLPPHFFE
ncbi:hypothetical protein HGA91_00050 [candidate division WWE3 bacterium]|nr:hypothetical protein [candidate division WWE3 bacterium]